MINKKRKIIQKYLNSCKKIYMKVLFFVEYLIGMYVISRTKSFKTVLYKYFLDFTLYSTYLFANIDIYFSKIQLNVLLYVVQFIKKPLTKKSAESIHHQVSDFILYFFLFFFLPVSKHFM